MALQGTLETFALPDVLRLLASTKKTGCYRLNGNRGAGSLCVKDGQLVGGEVANAPAIKDTAEITFELMRFTDGDFVFEDGIEAAEASEAVEVEAALEQAGTMLDEWNEIEAVVPSLDHWITLQPELPEDEVTIRADKWISVVAIGSGSTVRRLGTILGLGELPISRTVKELVEMGLIELGDAPPGTTAAAPAPAPAVAEPVHDEPIAAEPALAADVPSFGGDDEDPFRADTFHTDTSFGASDDDDTEPVLSLVTDDDEDAAILEFGGDEFEPFDPNGLVIEEPRVPSTEDISSDPTVLAEPEPAPAPAPPPSSSVSSGGEADPTDAAEIARQLANLSPKAAKAVAAAAKATTQEEREAALAEVDETEDPINRELLLKFLGSVNS